MAVEQVRRESKLAADGADFILIKGRERLDDSAFGDQALNSGDAVVMGLDQLGFGGASGFDGVGINRALAENPVGVEEMIARQNTLLHVDEFFADDVAFLFGVGGGCERGEEFGLGVGDFEGSGAELDEIVAHEFGLAFAHQAGIDVGAVHALRSQGFQA